MSPLNLKIDGMSCKGCIRSVTAILTQLPTVTPTQVDIGSASLTYDPTKTTPTQIQEKLSGAGFPATLTNL